MGGRRGRVITAGRGGDAMLLKDYIKEVSFSDVIKVLEGYYDFDETKGFLITWSELFNEIFNLEIIDAGNQDMWIELIEVDGYIDVEGRREGENVSYGLGFTDWKEILQMEVRTDLDLSKEEITAHIVYDITWYGATQDMIGEKKEIIKERILEVEEAIEEGNLDEKTRDLDDLFE